VSGIYASLAAVPLQPRWTVNETYYHWQGQAGADVAAAREVTIGRFNPSVTLNLSGNLNALTDIVFGTAIYTFEQPVLGGQAAVGLLAAYGRTDATVNATITGTVAGFPFGPFTRQDFGEAVGFGDLYPRATLRWNQGVNNYMLYVTGDIPVGLYNSSDLANIGIGHGAIDAGGAYTYFNPETGHEFSVTGGLTYNFINPSTQYQNGIDAHIDWGASQSSPNSSRSARSATSTSSSPATADRETRSAVSSRACSASARRSASSSRSTRRSGSSRPT
jgi:hypothetical protein